MKINFLLIPTFCLFTLQLTIAQYEGYSPSSWEKQLKTEALFFEYQNSKSFKNHLRKLTVRPHVVGSKENKKVQ